jgi:hypothetical protein
VTVVGADPAVAQPAAHNQAPQGGVCRPWLPEPLLTAPDVAEDIELAESVSMAMMLMLVLETLSPTERAVFALHEAFDVSYVRNPEKLTRVSFETPLTLR